MKIVRMIVGHAGWCAPRGKLADELAELGDGVTAVAHGRRAASLPLLGSRRHLFVLMLTENLPPANTAFRTFLAHDELNGLIKEPRPLVPECDSLAQTALLFMLALPS